MGHKSQLKKWYEVTQLFIDSRKDKCVAFRIYSLLKENAKEKALQKAIKIGESTPHPHGKVRGIQWKYVGPQHIYECFEAPQHGALLGHYKETGKTWREALVDLVRPESKFELNTFQWSKRPAPENLYHVHLIYFLRQKITDDIGTIISCSCIIESRRASKVLENVYAVAVNPKTKLNVTKIRPELHKKKWIVDFAGINEVSPIYQKLRDGMELDRTTESYASRSEVIKMYKKRQKDWKIILKYQTTDKNSICEKQYRFSRGQVS